MPSFWRDRPWLLRALTLATCLAVVALLQWRAPGAFATVENAMGDFTWRVSARDVPERRVVIVDIDEASLNQIGPWPWSRETITRLSQRLEAAGVAVQVFDLVLDAPRDGDAGLRERWAQASVVAGQIFSLDPDSRPQVGTAAGSLAVGDCPPFAPLSQGHIGNADSLLTPHVAVGHLTPRLEGDGVVRKVPAIVCHQGRPHPSLVLAALWRAANPVGGANVAADWTWVEPGRAGAATGIWAPEVTLTSASLPGVTIPLDRRGDMRVPYALERHAFASISARELLNGSADLSMLKGTIAIVGATAFGIGDVTATPLASVAAGVEVHAQALAGALDHRIPFTPRGAPLLQVLIAGLASIVLLAIVARRRGAPVKRLPIAGMVLALACWAAAAAALVDLQVWLPWAAPALFALLASTALATAEHALTRAQRERLSAHLGAYLPAPVAERLAVTDPSGTLQVDRREISVLVADIRNFSAFAAHRAPEETAALLHAFYCLAVDVVEQHGGVVENVVGDSVLAVWNAYAQRDDHPARALQAAKELLGATRALLQRPIDPDEDMVVQPLALGIGVETGQAIVGSFGPARRRAHAALGEPVSVASRLQQMTQDLSMPILIGPQLARQLPQGHVESLGDYLLEGLSIQYTVFAPADWVDLAPTDQLWMRATSTRPLNTEGVGGEGADSWQALSPTVAGHPISPAPLRDA